MERKKAFVIPFPQHGHINPMLSLARELVHNYNYDVNFYGLEDRREAIQSTGATYQEFKYFDMKNFPSMPDIIDVFGYQLKVTHHELPSLFEDCIREQPDVIIYDFMSLHGKFLVNLVRKKKCLKRPIGVCFTPTFATKPGIFPTHEEWSEITGNSFWMALRIIWLFFLQMLLSLKFRLNIWNTMKFFSETDDLNLIGISPEFQPKREHFGDEFEFIGHSASNELRKAKKIDNEKLKHFLDATNVVNPNFDPSKKNEKILIYASLGTVFNDNKIVFDKILEAYDLFKSKNSFFQTRLVMSVGQKVFDQYKNFKCPNDIIILPYVPQINVLEKASLYVTHCGMSSANEAVYYAVPVICIPMAADQPFVAKRLCDDLNLGLRLQPFDFTPSQLCEGIAKVLNDQSFHKRIYEFSKLMTKYNGGKVAAEKINKTVEKINKKLN
uniref:UDP-glucuronosyltransferase-like protein 5 n=1 Tax=Brachionus koreanus TaxID=1199090 RepID=A0A7H9SLM6_9BILA|nr:UDP-glucuronosyltransferase-like protein 5 [Brachionus koreanus]